MKEEPWYWRKTKVIPAQPGYVMLRAFETSDKRKIWFALPVDVIAWALHAVEREDAGIISEDVAVTPIPVDDTRRSELLFCDAVRQPDGVCFVWWDEFMLGQSSFANEKDWEKAVLRRHRKDRKRARREM